MKVNFKHLIYFVLSSFFIFSFYSCNESDSSGELATISDLSVTEIEISSARISAKIIDDGGNAVIEKGFCWSDSKENPDLDDSFAKVSSPGSDIEIIINSFSSNTTYYIRAYVTNDVGIAYSTVAEFKTKSVGFTVGKTEISEISHKGALLKSVITNEDDETVLEKGFCYSLNDQPTIDDLKVIVSDNSLEMTAEIDELISNTTYYVRAYVKGDEGVVYGEINTFRTLLSGEDELMNYEPPVYIDDYSSIAGWSQRHLWNLANVHDPTVEKCGDYYYMYGTDASYGNVHSGHGHFPYRRSKDLVNWEFQGMAMKAVPAWVKDTLNNMRERQGLSAINSPSYGYWAPVVRKAGNKYRMYYSIVIDNFISTGKQNTTANFDNSWTERAFIGLMETDDLATNNWVDKGMVVCSSTDKGNNWYRPSQSNWTGYFKWNAIDPTFIITPEGEHWLIYGSWHSGLVSLKLDPASGKPNLTGEPWDKNALSSYGNRVYTRDISSRWQGSEAPEIIYNQNTGYYYLFLAYDELSVAYNTRVCRSKNIKGPYLDFTGKNAANGIADCKPVLTHPYRFAGHSGWVGISHCCIFEGDNGNWYYSSQGRLPANTNGNAYSNAIMMGHIRKIRWTEDGWPVVMPERYANVPDVEIQESEFIGTWENITLKYNYGKMQTSQSLTLNSDKKASGALSGTWSWDPEKKILTIGKQKLYVEREVDWESSPRKHTLVYAGLNTQGESLWGKKK